MGLFPKNSLPGKVSYQHKGIDYRMCRVGSVTSEGAAVKTLQPLTPKNAVKQGSLGGEDSEVSNSKSTFCNIYFKTLMDSNNVNYNIAVHKDSQNRRRDILKRAWAQTLSAHPRNKKKSGETDSPPGGVGSWGHWEAQGGSCDVSASDPSCWSGVFGSSVSLLLEGFLLGFSREWPWGMPDQGWGGACGQYGPSCTPALAVTSISPHSLPEPAHCSLLKVWTTAGRIPADRRKITREYYCYVCQDLWKQMEGGYS